MQPVNTMLTPMPKDNTVGVLHAQTFHLFPRLPLELRQEIWKLALPLTSEKPGVCILSEGMAFLEGISSLTVKEHHSSLKAVCQEARKTALETLPVRRDYNPLIDIIYIDHYSFSAFCSRATIDDWSLVRHIALSLPLAVMGFNISLALFGLPGLEELSVVYPKSTGTVDLFDDVSVPETGPRKLRRFTQTEMSCFVIKADFIDETHGGDVPIVWEKDVRTHLDFVMTGLSQETCSSLLSCWDEERKRLMLTMHALCFEVDKS